MPGFGPNDPMTERAIGYRASLMQSGVKSYNGYNFPPCLNSQITVVPEYDDSSRTTKYLTIAISLEFIMTDSAVTAEGNASYSRNQKNAGIHVEVNSLLKRLNQPCQELIFTANGFGDFIVNGSAGVTDVDFGPKPQVIEYEMLGGSQAAKVTWLCITRVPPCMREAPGELIQFNYSTSWGIDNAGFMSRTIEGSAEIPLTRQSGAGNQHASSSMDFPVYKLNLIKKKILAAWPRLPWYRRQISFRIKENRKQISFKIEDVEIRSASPFLPGISDIDLNQNLSSSLEDGGFKSWKLVYSGTIEVVNSKTSGGIPEAKKVAWLWLGKILDEKRKQFESTVQGQLIDRKKPVPAVQAGQDATAQASTMLANEYTYVPSLEADNYNGGAIIYPVHISINDSIYGNVIQFTFGYVALVTTDLLGKAVGLFEAVSPKGLAKDSWVKFIAETKSDDASATVYEKNELIVDLCHSLSTSNGEIEEAHNVTETATNKSLMAVTAPERGKDWEDYKCTFRFVQDHQNVISTKLHGDVTATQDAYTSEQMQAINEEMKNFPFTGTFSIPSSGSSPEAVEARIETKVYSPNPSLCYVEMIGWACRFNNAINPPNLIGVGQGLGLDENGKGKVIRPELGGSLAHQYGVDDIKRSVQKTGLRDKQGNEVYRYYCSWKRKYILDRKPANGQVLTTGLPHRFNNELRINNG